VTLSPLSAPRILVKGKGDECMRVRVESLIFKVAQRHTHQLHFLTRFSSKCEDSVFKLLQKKAKREMKFVVLHQLPFCGFKGPLLKCFFISLSLTIITTKRALQYNLLPVLFHCFSTFETTLRFSFYLGIPSDHRAADIILLPFQVRSCLIILTSIYVCCFVGMFQKFDRFIIFRGFSTLKVESGYLLPIHGRELNKTKEQPAINNSQL
jgi:hypothetical protein